MKITKGGQRSVKEKIVQRGHDAGTLHEHEETESVGPFSVNPVHAEVRASLRVTPSRNYQSIAVECSIMIPVEPNADAIQAGYDWAFDECDRQVSRRMKKLQRILADMGD